MFRKSRPRGDRIAFAERISGRPWIRTVDLAGKSATLVGPVGGQGIAWSPSGEEIWFDDRGERGQYFLKAVNLTGRVRVLATLPVGLLIQDISPDGRVLVERYDSKPGIVVLAPGEAQRARPDLVRPIQPRRTLRRRRPRPHQRVRRRRGARGGASTSARPTARRRSSSATGAALDLSADGKWVARAQIRFGVESRPDPERNGHTRHDRGAGIRDRRGGGAVSRWQATAPPGRRARAQAPLVRSGPAGGETAAHRGRGLRIRPPPGLARRAVGRRVRRLER